MPVGKCPSSNLPRLGPCAQDSASERERGLGPESIGVIQWYKEKGLPIHIPQKSTVLGCVKKRHKITPPLHSVFEMA